VILSIIALISTPIIIGLIDNVRKEAFKDSAYGIVNAGKFSYSLDLLNGTNVELSFTYTNGVETSSVEGKELSYSGTKPKNGEVRVNNLGLVAIAIHNGSYCARKGYYESEIILSEEEVEECIISLYTDNTGAPVPELAIGMIPVVHDGTNWVKADVIDKWYDYNQKMWANAVLVTQESRAEYQTDPAGTIIEESNVLAYLVWIPRYKYKIFNVDALLVPEQTIEIIFEDKTTNKSSGSSNEDYLTHPAFTFEEEINGFWVGKFETTGDETTPTIKPGISSLVSQNVSTQFATAQIFNNQTIYGITSDNDAHMMKNIEWGAVAYLSHSIYGKNAEIWINPSSDYITGCAGTSASVISSTGCSHQYTTSNGMQASTTGSVYGIYDMSGGSWEYVMGALYNFENTTVMISDSGFTQEVIDNLNEKYINKYTYGTTESDQTAYDRSILGDATGEVRGWYGDGALFIYSSYSWMHRGGRYLDKIGGGIFRFSRNTGEGDAGSGGFRVVILQSNV
jgi:hypothetical protein